MIERVRDWLPLEAFDPEAISGILADPVAKWSQRWFARSAAGVATIRHESGLPSIVLPQIQRIDGAVTIATLPGRGKRHLLETALDVSLAEHMPNEGDHQLLDAFATEVVEDLVSGVDGLLGGLDARPDRGNRIVATISIARIELLSLSFPDHALVPRLKNRHLPLRRPTDKPGSRLAALRDTTLVTEAVLGSARLPVGDVEGLAIGDVLVLDQMLADRIILRLAGQHDPIAKGQLDRSRDGKVALQF